MKLTILTSVLAVLVATQNVEGGSREDILPAWETKEEKEIKFTETQFDDYAEAQKNEYEVSKANGQRRRKREKKDSTMPDSFRIHAEFEGTAAVMMTYGAFTDILHNISVSVAEAGAEVWMIGGPKSIPGVPEEKYKMFDFEYDSVWVRDYGPIGIDDGSGELGIVDHTYRLYKSRKEDDKIPRKLAKLAQKQPINTLRKQPRKDIENYYYTSLRLDGGNIMLDGNGNLFMTDVTYEWNPKLSKEEVNEKLRNIFGIKNIHALPYPKAGPSNPDYEEGKNFPADGTGHIDMYAKILDECQVLVTITEETSDSEDPFHQVLEDIADYFNSLPCGSDTYQVNRIPGLYDDWNSVWHTYTNSLIVNNFVIIPGYEKLDNDLAISIYEKLMPNHKVVSYNTDESIQYGGSIHCLTRDIPSVD